MRILARILGGLAAVLALFLLGGLLLPGSWSVRRSRLVEAPPESIFPMVDSPARWSEWTPWEEMESTYEGPDRGEGATRRWTGDRYGSGVFRIVESVEPRRVRYRVTVEDGSLGTDGEITLERRPEGTLVTWREGGDFGWNPLLGYAALTMERSQGEQLERSLRRLEARVEAPAGPPSPPG